MPHLSILQENLDQAIQYCESLGVRFTALAEENNQLDDAGKYTQIQSVYKR